VCCRELKRNFSVFNLKIFSNCARQLTARSVEEFCFFLFFLRHFAAGKRHVLLEAAGVCWSVLRQCDAVCCSVLQCVASETILNANLREATAVFGYCKGQFLCCVIAKDSTTHCNTHGAYCNTRVSFQMQHTATRKGRFPFVCIAVWCSVAEWCRMLQCVAVCCSVLQFAAVCCVAV